jgi:ABC-type phosphate transport system auxiliary subunit
MRAHYAISVIVIVLVAFGVKLFFWSAPTAEADTPSVESIRIDVSQMYKNADLPEQEIHDMTFVFATKED